MYMHVERGCQIRYRKSKEPKCRENKHVGCWSGQWRRSGCFSFSGKDDVTCANEEGNKLHWVYNSTGRTAAKKKREERGD